MLHRLHLRLFHSTAATLTHQLKRTDVELCLIDLSCVALRSSRGASDLDSRQFLQWYDGIFVQWLKA